MSRRESLSLPRRSLYYILLCVSGILAFVLIGIIPSQQNLRELDSEMSAAKAGIEEQKIIFPVFQDLLAKERKAYESGISLPSMRTRLPQEQIDGISGVMGTIAMHCSLEIVSVATDLRSLETGSKTLRVRATARGEFLHFRCFLLELNRLPYMEHIDEVRIQQLSEGKELQIVLALALGD